MCANTASKCALVTGGNGFVGSRLTSRLVAEGWRVIVVARSNSELSELNPVLSKIKVARIEESSQLLEIVAKVSPDVVFHLASKFVAEHKSDDVGDLIDSNIRFGTHLLEAMAVNKISRLVNAGTSWQHFESSKYRPVCLYAATKQAFESIIDFYIDAHGLRVITLKLFDTYGPNDPRPKLFAALRIASQSATPLAFSGGEQMLDLVYIEDVVDAFQLAADRLVSGKSKPKEHFAVSSGTPCSLRQIADVYASVLGVNLNVDWGARPYRVREVMVPWSAGEPIPGWRPRTSLREGIVRSERFEVNP